MNIKYIPIIFIYNLIFYTKLIFLILILILKFAPQRYSLSFEILKKYCNLNILAKKKRIMLNGT